MEPRPIIERVLAKVLAGLSDERLRQVLDYAGYLSLLEEGKMWSEASGVSLGQLYGTEETDYTEADFKPQMKS